jgi:ribosomal protein S12 methylthiotransferase accessory factor YcaO
MSLDRFIFCPCTHALEGHDRNGCTACNCSAVARDVIDRLLEIERDAIHRAWQTGTPSEVRSEATLRASADGRSLRG